MAKTGPKPMDPKVRFWRHVARRGDDECWEWQGSRLPKGYGKFVLAKGTSPMLAHRVAWYFEHGQLPELHVLHRCDNPSCVNPRHLFLGTNQDNIADRVAKGRSASGDRHWSHRKPELKPRGTMKGKTKLKECDIPGIRELLQSGARLIDIATRYGVSSTTISHVRDGIAWSHVA